MKILLASSSSGSRGGGELYLIYLGRALAARGHEVTLWMSDHPRMDELSHLFAPIGPVVRAPYHNTYDYRWRSLASLTNGCSAAIGQSWGKIGPDVIHVNKQNLEDGLELLRAATLSGRPSIATIHLTQTARYLRQKFSMARDWVARRALKAYTGPLACVLAERERDLRCFLGDKARIQTIPNGVELYDLRARAPARAAQRRELGITDDQLLLTAVGRLVPQKRPLVFLELAEKIHARLPHARFVWVGDGPLGTAWDQQVAQRQLSGFVQRLGWQKEVRNYLFAADVFLHTAEFEGLPLAILEALSAGLPCAITPNLLAEMPFLNSANSLAIDPQGHWAEILAQPAQLAVRGQRARDLAEAEFSFESMAARTLALYETARRGTS